MRHVLHPVQFAAYLSSILPAGFAAPIAVFQNWTYSLFYLLANMWGSVVVSLLFWGFANEVTTVNEAKKYYPLFVRRGYARRDLDLSLCLTRPPPPPSSSP